MSKVRVVITEKCDKRCRGCSKKAFGNLTKLPIEELFKYEEISITGGEPMLLSARAVEMVHRLRLQGYKGKIWLYTSLAANLKRNWAVKMLIDDVDGITFTLHSRSMDKLKGDLRDLRELDKHLASKGAEGRSDRLFIDSKIYNKEYVDSLKYKWAEVREVDKPLCTYKADDEDYVYYDLEGEQG